jgi:hypothetical protein
LERCVINAIFKNLKIIRFLISITFKPSVDMKTNLDMGDILKGNIRYVMGYELFFVRE